MAKTMTTYELMQALAYEADYNTETQRTIYGPDGLLMQAMRRLDQLQNEVNAVEWVNGRIEKELFECRKR